MNIYEASEILELKGLLDGLSIRVVKVNPLTNEVDENEDLNTLVEVWLETGLYIVEDECFSHDIRLDVGAATIDKAFIKLAQKALKYYKIVWFNN